MIRLATVFSGIGAIEHALQRMQIKNEIIFACDNGDVSILTKKIDMNIDEIGNELKALSKIIKKIQFNITKRNRLNSVLFIYNSIVSALFY